MQTQLRHEPVLLREAMKCLAPKPGEVYIDATFGAGGYTREILEAVNCSVIALDRDPTAVCYGYPLADKFGIRLKLQRCSFSNIDNRNLGLENSTVDGIVFDIGVSSMQLDQPERGFSFLYDGPLDMRMFLDVEKRPSAADLLRDLSKTQIAKVLYHYGEERRSKAIAAAITHDRQKALLTRTTQLADLCSRIYGRCTARGPHPATRTFQALRIAVNNELSELFRGLCAAERLLKPGGRIIVVTFHSLEDRIVKRFFNQRSSCNQGRSRYLPELEELKQPTFRNINRRPIIPSKQEVSCNPRARSAKLRAAIRTDAQDWGDKQTIGMATDLGVIDFDIG